MAYIWEALTVLIVYVWAQYNREERVSFMAGIRIPAMYLPFALAALNFLFVQDIYAPLMGILAGHAYYLLVECCGPQWRRRLAAPARLAALLQPVLGAAAARSRDADLAAAGIHLHKPGPSFQRKAEAPPSFKPFSGRGLKVGTS